MADEPLGIGLVGCGMIGQVHADGLRKLAEDGEIVAVAAADPSADARDAVQRNCPFGRMSVDALDVISDPAVDAVMITSPTATHLDLVRAADRPNGGLVFDTWHFFRGEPDFEVLAGIPGDRIFYVQLDDAPAVPSGPLREETQHRLLPGDGALDLVAAIRALNRIGGLRRVGPEVISPDLAALSVLDAATLAMDRTRALVDVALASP